MNYIFQTVSRWIDDALDQHRELPHVDAFDHAFLDGYF
jgi:quinol monooxygenase YgiN